MVLNLLSNPKTPPKIPKSQNPKKPTEILQLRQLNIISTPPNFPFFQKFLKIRAGKTPLRENPVPPLRRNYFLGWEIEIFEPKKSRIIPQNLGKNEDFFPYSPPGRLFPGIHISCRTRGRWEPGQFHNKLGKKRQKPQINPF